MKLTHPLQFKGIDIELDKDPLGRNDYTIQIKNNNFGKKDTLYLNGYKVTRNQKISRLITDVFDRNKPLETNLLQQRLIEIIDDEGNLKRRGSHWGYRFPGFEKDMTVSNYFRALRSTIFFTIMCGDIKQSCGTVSICWLV